MNINKILLLNIFVIILFINVEAYANTLAPWYIGGFLGTQLNANGNTKIPSIASKPPLTSEPVYDKGYNLVLTLDITI